MMTTVPVTLLFQIILYKQIKAVLNKYLIFHAKKILLIDKKNRIVI
jgi:hypothetical protein